MRSDLLLFLYAAVSSVLSRCTKSSRRPAQGEGRETEREREREREREQEQESEKERERVSE